MAAESWSSFHQRHHSTSMGQLFATLDPSQSGSKRYIYVDEEQDSRSVSCFSCLSFRNLFLCLVRPYAATSRDESPLKSPKYDYSELRSPTNQTRRQGNISYLQ
uniref:Uncharacterized protein n=1 Tax=Proboscia inermis TaxID=420281 RepID=A0A7S0CBD8_9STRA